jgi:hypothetical protein
MGTKFHSVTPNGAVGLLAGARGPNRSEATTANLLEIAVPRAARSLENLGELDYIVQGKDDLMADKDKSSSGGKPVRQVRRAAKSGRFVGATVLTERPDKTARGEEVWRVRLVEGELAKLTTSTSSASVMDDAVRIYSPALKRLAKK